MNRQQFIEEIYIRKRKGLCENYWECIQDMFEEYQDLTEEDIVSFIKSDPVFMSRLENDVKQLNLLKKKNHNKKVNI